MEKTKKTYGYTPAEYKKFTKHAWLMLLSFGLTYLFFYNGHPLCEIVMLPHRSGKLLDFGCVYCLVFIITNQHADQRQTAGNECCDNGVGHVASPLSSGNFSRICSLALEISSCNFSAFGLPSAA